MNVSYKIKQIKNVKDKDLTDALDIYVHTVDENSETSTSQIRDYIQNKYNIQTSQNWSRIIEFFSRTDEEAFDTFYRLLDEFLEQNSNYTKMKNI